MTNKVNIYLDIDGVLLTKDGEAARHAEFFLKKLSERHTVFWLTTHCKGDARTAREYLADKLPAGCAPYLGQIRPANWDILKTEGIDFSRPFRWFDDAPLPSELEVLRQHGCEELCIRIDLQQDPDQLADEAGRAGFF